MITFNAIGGFVDGFDDGIQFDVVHGGSWFRFVGRSILIDAVHVSGGEEGGENN